MLLFYLSFFYRDVVVIDKYLMKELNSEHNKKNPSKKMGLIPIKNKNYLAITFAC